MSSGISSTVCAAQAVAGADPHPFEAREHVELGQRQPLDPRGANREPQRRKVQPAAAARPARDRAELVAALAQQVAGRVGAARSGTDRPPPASRSPSRFPDTVSICVGPMPRPAHAPPAVADDDVTNGYVPWSMSRSTPCAPSNITFSPRTIASCTKLGRVADVGTQLVRRARGSARRSRSRRARRRPAPSAAAASALDLARELPAEPLGVQQIADPHAGARGLALVGRADPLARGADGVLGAFVAQPIDLAVVRQRQVRARGDDQILLARAGSPAPGRPAPPPPAPSDRRPSLRRARR